MGLFDKDLIESEEHFKQKMAEEDNIALSIGPGA